MEFIYSIAFLASLGGLVSWFLFQGNKALSRPASAVFLLGFLLYLVALSLAAANFPYKLLILFRDLLVIAIVSQLFNVFRKSIIAAIVMGAVAFAILYFSYFNVLLATFPQMDVKELHQDGEFLVRVERDAGESYRETLGEVCNCEVQLAFVPASTDLTTLDDYYLVDAPQNSALKVKRLYSKLKRLPFVKWIEPNEVVRLDLPDDDLEPLESKAGSYLNDPGIARQWSFGPLEMNELHKSLVASGAKPARPARIAIIDSGVDAKHEDIKRNYLSFNKKYDVDPLGHGTHCAGIAAAVSNNKIGIASVAPGRGYVTITSFVAINAQGMGSQHTVIKAMIEAVDFGADVLSMSLGGQTSMKKEKAYTEAVEYARDHGAIVVVAAGNSNVSAINSTPANVDGVIAVSAIDQHLQKSHFSNTIEEVSMGIAAPGTQIYSTYPSNSYKALNGTSMAAPHVAGLIGLMRAYYPDLTTDEAYLILNRTGRKIQSTSKTGKLIQPLKALNEVLD